MSSYIKARTKPGRNCQSCGAFVTLPEVLPFHNCATFRLTHTTPTTLELMRPKAQRKEQHG